VQGEAPGGFGRAPSGGPPGAARHTSSPLPGGGGGGGGGARGGGGGGGGAGGLPQFDPSSVFGAAAAQSFDAPWPGPAPEPGAGAYGAGEPADGPAEGASGGALAPPDAAGASSRARSGEAAGQRRTESEPVASYAARRAPMNFLLGEYVARQQAALGLAQAGELAGGRCGAAPPAAPGCPSLPHWARACLRFDELRAWALRRTRRWRAALTAAGAAQRGLC